MEKYKVLVVAEDESIRKSCRQVVERNPDFQVEEAGNSREAVEAAERAFPDIVLCDPGPNDLEGMALCRLMKKDPDSTMANIYFIMIGGERSTEHKIKCIDEGVDDYLTKPFDPDELLARIKVGKRIAVLLKKTELATEKMFHEIDILLVQEGGCAPGYNPVTAFITYHLESQGRKVFATREGFKSLVCGRNDDFVRLVYDPDVYKRLDHIPGVFHAAPLSESRGAQLRSERFKDFLKKDVQEEAAATIRRKKVNAIIAIGGNGTFKGIRSLCDLMPTSIQVFFIPVTIDSDVAGTDCIGQHTGIEIGAEKIQCYMADARTHKRTYIVEMMGASSGFHALHSCLGARAHLAVLPGSEIDHKAVVEALNKKEECVIVVAEGYRKKERDAEGFKGNAARYFHSELLKTGIPIKSRVVCEPFSRDIRGTAPNNQDITLAQRMAYNVASYLKAGTSRLMPAVQSGREYAIPFNQIQTDNMKEKDLLVLSDRLTRNSPPSV
ncbi:MAG: 6-phosphofructokinase [Pseudomonadota bacterium]